MMLCVVFLSETFMFFLPCRNKKSNKRVDNTHVTLTLTLALGGYIDRLRAIVEISFERAVKNYQNNIYGKSVTKF